jgi:UDP-N-acetylglucosamine 2-epimerase (non-hydrolysing)
MKIDLIAGARPNFVKIAPIIDAIREAQNEGKSIHYRLVHTGQHYDKSMSGDFFVELGIPDPNENLGAGGGSQAEQTAAIMVGYEKLLMKERPDLCLVVGDVTSTLACAITAQKMHVKVAHVEAGIRSGDWTMPEEINRMVTDSITNYFFTTSETANANLRKSGVEEERIFFVGNTMIDTLIKNRPRFKQPAIWNEIGLTSGNYLVMTLHRPANVDGESLFGELLGEIIRSSRNTPIIFPVHPRTKKMIELLDKGINDRKTQIGLTSFGSPNLHLISPLGYLEFNYLVEHSKAVITDSGGITEETTVLGIPCITLRDNTERPETISIGTNELIGTNPKAIKPALDLLFEGQRKKGGIPEKWDGITGKRIIDYIFEIFNSIGIKGE